MSFRLRVFGLLALVALVATGATAWLTLAQAERQVRESAAAGRQDVARITGALRAYGFAHGTWDGVAPTVAGLARDTGQRIRVATETDVLVTDSDALSGRTPRPPGGQAPLVVDPRPVLRLPAGRVPRMSVKLAVRAMADYRVAAADAACLTRAGVPVTARPDALGVPVPVPVASVGAGAGQRPVACPRPAAGGADPRTQQDLAAARPCETRPEVAACLQRVFAERTAAVAPPRLQVRLGVRDEAPPTLAAAPTVAVAGGVALAVILGALLLARGVLRPVRELTLAAQELGEGDLGRRVPVPGTAWGSGRAGASGKAGGAGNAGGSRKAGGSGNGGGPGNAEGSGDAGGARNARGPGNAEGSGDAGGSQKAGSPGKAGGAGKGRLSERGLGRRPGARPRRDEIARLAAAFNRMADSLQAGEERQRRLTGDIAHELRTPLANLRGYLEALRDGVVEPTPELLESLHEEALLQQRIVDDLQDLALAEAGALTYHRRTTDVRELLRAARTAHRARAEAAGVEVVVEADGPVRVHADPDRLRQVVANLVGNALRATPPGGTVTLALRRDRERAVVEVRDTGTGIAAEDLPHVFDRFWRADPARGRATGGSGLGLAVARQIVLDHGGTIGVDSAVGAGTTVTVTLPAGGPGAGQPSERR
ncbi:ATP-binding protein [Streptomyces griseosporeus]|uniref:ATP-binding protein n=1 Tax=Streptomyces griseosporeus TaxID=1910 RepID=UPI0037015CDF